MTKREDFRVARTASEVEILCLKQPEDAMIFFDIDNTLIIPQSKTFHSPPYNKIIDEIKYNKGAYQNYEEILSNWRLQRKVMLLDEHWPAVLEVLKQRYPVYGLTKMDTGIFGNIPSMEEWRYQELKNLGLNFSQNHVIMEQSIQSHVRAMPRFYHGIFMTGAASKQKTLECYTSHITVSNLVMIDDRLKYLHEVEHFCREGGIVFRGILFDGLSRLASKPDPAIVELQRKQLMKYARWLEDEEAAKLL